MVSQVGDWGAQGGQGRGGGGTGWGWTPAGQATSLTLQHSLLHMLGQTTTQSQPQWEEGVSSKRKGSPAHRASAGRRSRAVR